MTTELTRITAHAADTTVTAAGLRRIVSQLRGKAAFEALLTTYLDEIQALESATWELYALTIDNSSDDALDQLGDMFNMPRPPGLTDAVYRRLLHGCVAALTSAGRGNDLLRVARALVGPTPAAFVMTEVFPAAFIIAPAVATGIPIAAMRGVLARAKAAGVGLAVIDVPDDDWLLCSSSMMRVDTTDPDHGFSDTSQIVGGALVGVM